MRRATRWRAIPRRRSIALATAHPAKFPDAVERAVGVRPALPRHLSGVETRRERFTVLPNDVGAVAKFVREHARVAA